MRKAAERMAAWLLFRVSEQTASTLEQWVVWLCLGDMERVFEVYRRHRWLCLVSTAWGRVAWSLFPGGAEEL